MPQAGSQIVSPGFGPHARRPSPGSAARGVKYWPAPALMSSAFFSQQALVGVALHVGARASTTVSLSIRSTISRRSLAGSWILFCALRKITPSMPCSLAELLSMWR